MTSVTQRQETSAFVERGCVYTALIGGYERLTEQPVARESSLDFLCFTDDPSLESETWTICPIEPLLPRDPVRSQRSLKIRAHATVPGYDVSVYIDNSLLLLAPPEQLLADVFAADAELAVMKHRFRDTIADEFDVVVEAGLDHRERCEEQRAHYRRDDPASLGLRPLASPMLLRRHTRPRVIRAMDLWFTHVLRYSRRDQLSIWYALRATGLDPLVLELDNFESKYHRWPVEAGRRKDTSLWKRDDFVAMRRRLIDLEAELAALNASRSWRWTAPARRVRAGRGSLSREAQPASNESMSPEPSQSATSR